MFGERERETEIFSSYFLSFFAINFLFLASYTCMWLGEDYYFVCELLFSLATLGHKNSHSIFHICRGGKLFMTNNKVVFVTDSHESQ